MKPGIFTIGYEGRTTEDVTSLLTRHGVQMVVDVRERPLSRKPGFSKSKLATILGEVGIEYRHEPQLGNPVENRQPFRDDAPGARDRYRRILTNGAGDAVTRILELGRTNRLALLCFEHDHNSCHRSVISDRAVELEPGLTVTPI